MRHGRSQHRRYADQAPAPAGPATGRGRGPARQVRQPRRRRCGPSTASHSELMPGEVLCLIGESGSGKTVTMRALMRLLPRRRAVLSGRIRVGGRDILALERGRAHADARLRDCDGVPGADDGARSGLHHRRSDRRDGDAPRRLLAPRRHGARAGAAAGSCGCPRRSGGSTPIRTNCRAACASAPPSRSRCRAGRACCSPTSRPPRSTPPSRSRC